MAKEKKTTTEYFTDLKKRATIELFNIENASSYQIKDIEIIKQSLKNMIFYADKKLNPSSSEKDKKTNNENKSKSKKKN